ncbi:SSI family serine proteinase inhibitor [Actinomadura parmotrematis]|uniref:Subtilase-type protease inhibitor n=1 Tax=Actinomadura parmotrematis TaxID=2864039 RepID=A0ABS7G1Q6_9ACTN|nr:SSI family serine proteinase inhibitor [Actinomadura parmotrematis]MBW8485814.1 subtilase-type protease inhibitor [Actinomadura parmotrematis]
MSVPHLVASVLASAALAFLPTPPPAAPRTEVRLALTRPGDHISAARSVVLRCDPPAGEHPRKEDACRELEQRRGRAEAPAKDVVCTREYAPVVADASGMWRGSPVAFHARYANSCELSARTGALFAF